MEWTTEFPQVFLIIYLLLRFGPPQLQSAFLATLLLMGALSTFGWLAVGLDSVSVREEELQRLVWLTAAAGFGLLWRQTIGLPLADRVQEWLDSEPEPSPDDYPPR